MISQNIAETLINITTMLNRFKSFIKKVYEKEWRRNINKKKEQNNCFRKGISQKVEKVLTLEKKSALIFNSRKNLLFFLNSIFIKVTMPTYICPTRNWQLFLILTLWNFFKSKIYYRSWIYIKFLRNNFI